MLDFAAFFEFVCGGKVEAVVCREARGVVRIILANEIVIDYIAVFCAGEGQACGVCERSHKSESADRLPGKRCVEVVQTVVGRGEIPVGETVEFKACFA